MWYREGCGAEDRGPTLLYRSSWWRCGFVPVRAPTRALYFFCEFSFPHINNTSARWHPPTFSHVWCALLERLIIGMRSGGCQSCHFMSPPKVQQRTSTRERTFLLTPVTSISCRALSRQLLYLLLDACRLLSVTPPFCIVTAVLRSALHSYYQMTYVPVPPYTMNQPYMLYMSNIDTERDRGQREQQ